MGTRVWAVAAAVAVALTAAGSAHAQPRAQRVTLPSGDRVVLTMAPDGTQSVTVDGTRTFHTVRSNGDIYAYPVALEPYIGSRLDRDLFNVSKLVEQGYADRASASWFTQPQRPSVIREWETGDQGQPVTRDGNKIEAFVPEWMDAAGRFGLADLRWDTSALRLYEDGELIAESGGLRGSFTVGDEPATYRAELDVARRAPWWRWSTDTETAWTFASGPSDEPEALPLLLVDYDVGELDILNRAERGPRDIGLQIHRQQGAPPADVTDVRVWASFNDGGTWRRLDVEDRGGGNFSAAINHPQQASAQHVSLRVQATDADGGRIVQTIMRAYGLR